MINKKKYIIVICVTLVISMICGYLVMYIKTPSSKEEEINTTIVESENKTEEDELNFSDYLYDIDGDETSTSVKVSNGVTTLTINNKEYTLNEFKNVKSVRVEHTTKGDGSNIIFILDSGILYHLSDTEYLAALKAKIKPVFGKCDVKDVESIATLTEKNESNNYTYPTIYAKTKKGNIYKSRFARSFELVVNSGE